MTGRCCKASASILPAALLVLLPKCPLCLAAWLTAATGVGFTAAGASWARWTVVLVAALGVAWHVARAFRASAVTYDDCGRK